MLNSALFIRPHDFSTVLIIFACISTCCAFHGCSSLVSVTIPNSITSIAAAAFAECTSLTSISIPNSVKTIEIQAFVGCSALTSITIPTNVTFIGEEAFAHCSSLTTVTNLVAIPQQIDNNLFYNVPLSSAILYVPAAALQIYKNTEGWSDFGNIEALFSEYSLPDAENFANNFQYPNIDITYSRTFYPNVWNAWFVPFAASTEMLAENGLTAAYIEGIHNYDDDFDGTIDRTVMEVVKIANGTLRPGTPYLIKAAEDYTYPLVFENATLMTDTDVHPIHTETATTSYDFIGTYSGVDAATTSAAGNYYSLDSNNAMVHRTGKILPLRWYMTATPKDPLYDGASASHAKPMSIRVIGEEDESTGIRTLYAESEQKQESADGIFTLDGVRHAAPQKGLNVINGQIILMR